MILKETIELYQPLKQYISGLISGFDSLSEERKILLKTMASCIKTELINAGKADLVFICTHNSRRSHLAQIWAQTAAYYCGIEGIKCYSGGTEVTAFNPRAVKAIEKTGFKIGKSGNEENPHYRVSFSDNHSLLVYSKKFDAPENPSIGFCAILTCSDADEKCPFIPGANRISLTYDDPKQFDGGPLEEIKYDERCREIAGELFYGFSLLKP